MATKATADLQNMSFINNFYMEKQQIDALATASGYREIPASNPYMYSYVRDGVRINVYYGRMTVATCLNHPKYGRTQLFRRNVTAKQLNKIFENPRTHTGKGYYGDIKPAPLRRVTIEEALQHSCLLESDKLKIPCPACGTMPSDLCANRFVRWINSFFL